MPNLTLSDKAEAFWKLHRQAQAFIIPNPWDAGTARILAGLGFQALATTSAGHAFSLGRRDNAVGRPEVLDHLRILCAATDLPVSADLGNGFGDAPAVVAETLLLAGETGIVGGSIEDATGSASHPIYERELAAERVRAAVAGARRLPFRFTLTARCENYLHGRRDLRDTIERLQLYQEAGADVLYAPGLTTAEEITAVTAALDRPVNVLMGLPGPAWTAAELSRLGVKRISVGSVLARVALGSFLRAAQELAGAGSFAFAESALSSRDANALFSP